MTDYAGLSLRDIYARRCDDLHCKRNSTLMKTLPSLVDRFDTLEEIDLTTNFVGPKGLLPVLEVVKVATAIKILSLRDNQLTNQSVQGVVEICMTHRSLLKLDFSCNPITLSAGRALLELAQTNPNIISIAIDDTNIRPMVARSVQLQCSKNLQMTEKQRDGNWNPLPTATQVETKVEDGKLEESTIRSILSSLPHSVHPILFDVNPVDSFLVLCEQHNVQFNDTQFTTTPGSVQSYPAREYGVCGWRRVTDICRRATLFNESSKLDVNAHIGAANSSWILACLAEISRQSLYDQPLSNLFYPQRVTPYGVYAVKFFINGKWRYVIIDDYIPCDQEGLPVFLKPGKGEEVWLLLLEKAIAKLHGSYQALDSCVGPSPQASERTASAASLLMDLTAGVGISRDLHHAEFDANKWWETLEDVVLRGALATTWCDGADAEEKLATGLCPYYTYVIRNARSVNGFKLLYLYSSWTPTEQRWSGEWSDDSALWAQYTDIAQALNHKQGHVDESQGFWLPYHLYLKYFASVSICRVFGSSHNTVLVEGKWSGKSAGGPHFEAGWCFNPHYELRVEQSENIFIHLHLPDSRFASSEVEAIAFHVLRSDYFPLRYDPDNVTARTAYIMSDSVTYEGHVEAGQYWMVPCTYSDGQESSFMMRLFSPSLFSLCQMPLDPYWREVALQSRWTSSGEYQNGEDNPQFLLNIPPPSGEGDPMHTCHLVVTMSIDDAPDSRIIFFICSSDDGGRILGSIAEDVVAAKSKYLIADSVSLTTSLPAGRYVVVCSLQPEGSRSRCDMSFWCTRTNFMVKELPFWKKKELKSRWESSGDYQSGDRHPQFELVVPVPMRVVIKATVAYCNDPAIVFFVVDNTATPAQPIQGPLPESRIRTQSTYVRAESVSQEFEVTTPQSAYVIIPCLQPPGSKGVVTVSVSSSSDDFQLNDVTL